MRNQLQRTCRTVFREDEEMLQAARRKVNEEFRKNKGVRDSSAVEELLKFGNQVERVIRTTVVQAKLKPDAPEPTYELRVTKDTVKLDNTPYLGLQPCSSSKS